jgi:hypothetical protein
VGVRSLITGVIDELLQLAEAQGCLFRPGFREATIEQMILPTDAHSTMYQDFSARRPMEIETYLGSPIKLAQEAGVSVPRIETLYSLLHNANIANQNRPPPQQQQQQAAPAAVEGAHAPQQRMSSAPGGPGPRGYPPPGPQMRNGMRMGPGSRAPSAQGGPPPPGARRGPPPGMNGYPPRLNGNGYGPRGPPPQQMQRKQSFEGDLPADEFSHLMLYDNIPEGQMVEAGYDGMTPNPSMGDLNLREREYMLRQKEAALREQEFHMRRRGPRGPPPPASHAGYDDDDDEDGADYFDPSMMPTGPPVDTDNLDMMSVTSRRTRKAPSASQLRNNPEGMGPGGAPRNSRGFRRPPVKNRASTTIMSQMPNLREELMSNPLMGYSSDRYGDVDRHNMGQESRTNSLTAERLHEMQRNGHGGQYGGPPMSRRGSHSPGNPLSPNGRPAGGFRPSPPNTYHGPPPPGMMQQNGRPSPPGMRQPVPRHPPGHGNAIAPQQVEQQVGVSHLYPPKSGPQVRSLTGSASASAGSGDSNRSAPIDSSEPSAHSSSSSLGPRRHMGVA